MPNPAIWLLFAQSQDPEYTSCQNKSTKYMPDRHFDLLSAGQPAIMAVSTLLPETNTPYVEHSFPSASRIPLYKTYTGRCICSNHICATYSSIPRQLSFVNLVPFSHIGFVSQTRHIHPSQKTIRCVFIPHGVYLCLTVYLGLLMRAQVFLASNYIDIHNQQAHNEAK